MEPAELDAAGPDPQRFRRQAAAGERLREPGG
jgi:hypothetical protein